MQPSGWFITERRHLVCRKFTYVLGTIDGQSIDADQNDAEKSEALKSKES